MYHRTIAQTQGTKMYTPGTNYTNSWNKLVVHVEQFIWAHGTKNCIPRTNYTDLLSKVYKFKEQLFIQHGTKSMNLQNKIVVAIEQIIRTHYVYPYNKLYNRIKIKIIPRTNYMKLTKQPYHGTNYTNLQKKTCTSEINTSSI